jgi:hypothetical protein
MKLKTPQWMLAAPAVLAFTFIGYVVTPPTAIMQPTTLLGLG